MKLRKLCLFKLGIGIKIVSQLPLKYSFFCCKINGYSGSKKIVVLNPQPLDLFGVAPIFFYRFQMWA